MSTANIKKIFIADPEVTTKVLQDEFCSLPDFFVAQVNKGQYSALDMLYELKYDIDVAIISLIQPRGDGISLTEEIRRNELFRHLPHPIDIYWITERAIGDSDTDVLVKARDDNKVRGVFVRPCGIGDVVRSIVSGAPDKDVNE